MCLSVNGSDRYVMFSLEWAFGMRVETTSNTFLGEQEQLDDKQIARLIGALLAEQNEAWQERKYLDMDEFKEWADAQIEAKQGSNIVALAG